LKNGWLYPAISKARICIANKEEAVGRLSSSGDTHLGDDGECLCRSKDRCFPVGMDDFLTKPANPEVL
jgi:hypothetical protein